MRIQQLLSRRGLLCVAMLGCGCTLMAQDITLPAVFSDNMVLQQNASAPIWGGGVGGQEIKIVASWQPNDTLSAKIDPYGKWEALLPTGKAGGPYTLTIISQNSTKTLKNILLGEVWLCSGQSNMEWRAQIGIKNKEEEIVQADYPQIRLFNVPNCGSDSPQEDCDGNWVECTPETMPLHSAVSYFFGRELHKQLNVPIGLITAEWGGTPAEVWLPKERVEGDWLLQANKPTQTYDMWPTQSGVLYNQMINPIIDYRLAGCIWYQGESNVDKYATYHRVMKALIEEWRKRNGEDFPFYFVQIAPFAYGSPYGLSALLREQQEMTWKEVANTGMVVTNDLVDDVHNIHPQDKQNVGLRLANWALSEKYGQTGLTYKSPTFKSMRRHGNKLIISLDNAPKGIYAKGKSIKGLEVFNNTGKYIKVASRIENGELVISGRNLEAPVTVAYCFNDTLTGNLFSCEGALPVAPFRAFEDGGEACRPQPLIQYAANDIFKHAGMQQARVNGYLSGWMSRNIENRLLQIDEAGLIEPYIKRPGNHPWAGEHVGKYLESAANTWLRTHDERVKKQMDRMAILLIASQLEDGYLGTYPDKDRWTGWDVWSHKYNLYGLLAYYKATGYKGALEACQKMGDLLCSTFGTQPGQKDIIKSGTHVGMAATSILDPMIELYRYTADKKYLDFCHYLIDAWEQENGPKIMSDLANKGKVNQTANGKAYEMLSNLLGLTNFYRLTGESKYLNAVATAWNDIVENRLYVTGTTSSWEYFRDDKMLLAGNENGVGEGCVTTTWLQLNQALFETTGEMKYMDEAEKTIYNHLLAAENPHTGNVSYFTPLMGAHPGTNHITCCMSSIPRGIALIPNSAFGIVNQAPTLLLYEAGEYETSYNQGRGKKNIRLTMKVETSFPEANATTVTVQVSSACQMPLAFRVPEWCTSYVASVDNETFNGVPGEILTINRLWKTGDKINISFQTPITRLNGEQSYPFHVGFKKGPQVLAFDDKVNFWKTNETKKNGFDLTGAQPDSSNHAEQLPKEWFGKQAYKINDRQGNDIMLVPYAEAGQKEGNVSVWLPLAWNQHK